MLNYQVFVEFQVVKAVHGINPVLIWCTNDTLKPKLILESPRPVMKLSFCDFDENILIGGCVNGQIVSRLYDEIINSRYKLNCHSRLFGIYVKGCKKLKQLTYSHRHSRSIKTTCTR